MMENQNAPNNPGDSERAEPVKSGGAEQGTTVRQRRVNRWRLAWFLIALLLVMADTAWFCWLQPAPLVELNPKFSFQKWLWQPHEKSAVLRLPTVPDSDLRGVFFTNNLGWVVGSGGVILHTRDGGESWELQTNIAWPKPVAPPVPKNPGTFLQSQFSPKQESLPNNLAANALNVAQKGYASEKFPAFPEQDVANKNSAATKGNALPKFAVPNQALPPVDIPIFVSCRAGKPKTFPRFVLLMQIPAGLLEMRAWFCRQQMAGKHGAPKHQARINGGNFSRTKRRRNFPI